MRLSGTRVLGTPPKLQNAFSRQRRNSSVFCRGTASLYALREWDRTMRNRCGRLRFPSALTIEPPLPKSICASSPGAHSMRRNGSGVIPRSRRTNRCTDKYPPANPCSSRRSCQIRWAVSPLSSPSVINSPNDALRLRRPTAQSPGRGCRGAVAPAITMAAFEPADSAALPLPGSTEHGSSLSDAPVAGPVDPAITMVAFEPQGVGGPVGSGPAKPPAALTCRETVSRSICSSEAIRLYDQPCRQSPIIA